MALSLVITAPANEGCDAPDTVGEAGTPKPLCSESVEEFEDNSDEEDSRDWADWECRECRLPFNPLSDAMHTQTL